MAGYLVYWRTYWKDQNQAVRARGPFWVTDNRRFHAKVNPGDRIWVVVHSRDRSAEWRLLRRIWVRERTPDPSPTKWGKWHILGDQEKSIDFDPVRQPDLASILLLLRFENNRPIMKLGAQIGKYLQSQGHRTLSDLDIVLLENLGASLARVGL